jgi:ankyrin repeat protein
MAPEFFPFLFAGFCAGLVIALVVAAIFVNPLRYVLQSVFSLLLKHLRPILLVATVPVLALLVCDVVHIRQQLFLNEPMVSAVSDGDIVRVRELLDQGASPNGYGIDYVEPAIVAAAEGGFVEIVQLLLSRGADPQTRDHKGRTALACARERGYKEIEIMLLEAGAEW